MEWLKPMGTTVKSPSRFVRETFAKSASLEASAVPSALLAFSGPLLALAVLLSQNGGRVAQPLKIIEVGLVAGAISAIAAIVVGRIFSTHMVGILMAVAGYAFFSASWIPDGPPPPRIAIWAMSSVIAAFCVGWLIGSSSRVFRFATASIIVLTAFLLLPSLRQTQPAARPQPQTLAYTTPAVRTPNVYVLLLDGFIRPDILMEQFAEFEPNIDGSLANLESRGFVAHKNASSSYGQTELSVPSLLNASYQLTPQIGLSFDERWDYAEGTLSGDNNLVRFFDGLGYEYWHSSSGLWDHAQCIDALADRCLGPGATGAEALQAAWATTPIADWMNADAAKGQDPENLVREIIALRDEGNTGPYVVFAHLLSPHHPYRYDEHCNDAPKNTSSVQWGHGPEHRPLYVDQVECLALQLERAMTDLVASDPDAVVVLQADHGTYFSVGPQSLDWSDEAIMERYSTFRMVRLPNECRSDAPEAQLAVNTLPLLIGCVTGEAPDLIAPRWFLTTYHLTEEVREFSYPDVAATTATK